MADVKKIKLPDNSVVNIKDYRIPGVDTTPTSGSDNVITSGGIYAANYAGSTSNGGPANMTVSIPFAKPDSTSTSTAYIVQVSGITELRDGVCFYLENNKVTSAANCTIDVNSLGAKPIYLTTAAATRASTEMKLNHTWLLVYNSSRVSGGCWDLVYTFNSNTTYTLNYLLEGSNWKAKRVLYRYQLVFQVDGNYLTPLNQDSNTTGTTKTIGTDYKFDPFGIICYYRTTTTVAAESVIDASNLAFVQSAVDLRYTFNVSTSVNPLSQDLSPVYLKINIDSDGMANLASNQPLTQTLPETNDGIYYLYLGRSTTTKYTCSLEAHHPIYYHDGTKLCELLPTEQQNSIKNVVSEVTGRIEYVTATALNDLNDRILSNERNLVKLSYSTDNSFDDITANDLAGAYDAAKAVIDAGKLPYIEIEMDDGDWRGTFNLVSYDLVPIQNLYSISFVYLDGSRWQVWLTLYSDGSIAVNNDSTTGKLNTTATTAQSTRSDELFTGNITLHKISKTGNYNDLLNRPTIPTVNNSTITVQMNSSTVDSFTTNASSAKTIDLGTVITAHQDISGKEDITNKVTSLSSLSTDTQYPSAKCVYDAISETEEVTAAALNDLNDRTTALETEDSPKQRYIIGTADQEQYDMDDYIAESVSDPQEGDIFIPYDTSKRYTDIVKVGSETVTFNDYQEQGWPSSTGTFIRYTAPDAQNAYLEIVANSTGTYKFYGIYNISSDYYEYPSFDASITNDELCSDGKYRLLLSTWVDGGILLYYTGSDPNIEINRCAPFGYPSYEYINGSWCDRSVLEQKAHEYITVGELYDNENNYPSNSALLTHLKSYPYNPEAAINYTPDNIPLTFSYIPTITGSASIYLKCNEQSASEWTVEVRGGGNSSWTTKTTDTVGPDGKKYVLLGTINESDSMLQVRGNNTTYANTTIDYCKFHMSGPCYVYGDLMSLIGGHVDKDGDGVVEDISDAVYAKNTLFCSLFRDEINLYSHPTKRLYLVSTRVATSAYEAMFYGCKNMTCSPVIACSNYKYNSFLNMFVNCDNLKVLITTIKAQIGSTWYPVMGNQFNSGSKVTCFFAADSTYFKYFENYYYAWNLKAIEKYGALISQITNCANQDLFAKLLNNTALTSNTIEPDRYHIFGTLTGSKTFILSTKEDDPATVRHYFWTFDTGSTVYSITWPTGLIWPGGSPPAILANKHYEISVLNNVVAWMEV